MNDDDEPMCLMTPSIAEKAIRRHNLGNVRNVME